MEATTYSGKALEILDAAERYMRRGGFDAVSFRDLAADVGIKSASVHYHFPHKADLGEAVVRRYMERFLKVLGAPDDQNETVATRIGRLTDAYRSVVLDDGMVCLCCVLGSETLELPPPVGNAVNAFFSRVLDWTDTALASEYGGSTVTKLKGSHIISSLQGAMILALAMDQPQIFADTVDRIEAQLAGRV